ncbi:MAG TPA: histidine kinase, partial [Solirubrobacteraceae bacterium]|nr:histidine kinase [Solirubrobacteraceae bacterium]
TEFGPVAAAYAVGAYTPGIRALAVAVLAGAALAAVNALPTVATGNRPPSWVANLVSSAALMGTSFLAGRVVRARREIAAARTSAAIAEERARIARELHDVVAHHVGVMVIQAGAGRRLVADHPEQAREAFAQIERSGREALTAMPAILGALRGDGATAPQPSVTDLGPLFDDARAAGLTPRLDIEGEPRPLPPALDVSAYRIVEEALTNAAKHAGAAAAVEVRVRYLPGTLELVVADDGRGGDGHDEGFGLVGMRERVELLGGHVSVGPRTDGGFAVRATLPLPEVAP